MRRDSPTLTVIMPVYNASRYVQQAIDSVLGQTFSDFELFIIDDGSTDRTRDILNRNGDPRIRLFLLEKNIGKVGACNQVLHESTAKYITIHDADDYSHARRFERQIDFLEKNPSFAMCGTQFYEINARGETRKISLETDPDRIHELLREDSQFHGPTMMLKKAILPEIGGLYRNFRNKEDVDLAMRIAEKYNVTNLDEYLYYYRLIPQGLSKVNFDFLRFEGLKVLQALARERQEEGKDCLMTGDVERYNNLLSVIKQPYIQDPSLLYRKAISLSVYFKFWRNAYLYAFKAIFANPLKSVNYREFLYVIKVSILDLIEGG